MRLTETFSFAYDQLLLAQQIGEWYCCMFLQVTEIKLCIFKEPLPKQRILFPFVTTTASEWRGDLYFELHPPGVKSWISSCICWKRGSLCFGFLAVSGYTDKLWIITFFLLWKLLCLVNKYTLKDFSFAYLSKVAFFLFWCNVYFTPFDLS